MESTNFTEQPQALYSENQSLSSIHRGGVFQRTMSFCGCLTRA
jgi:hypothetical protein